MSIRLTCLVSLLAIALSAFASAQESGSGLVVRVKPETLTLAVGATAQLEAEVVDIGGRPVKAEVFFFSRERRAVRVDRDGKITARKPGTYTVIARAVVDAGEAPSAKVTVTVPFPKPAKVTLSHAPGTLHVGTTATLAAAVLDEAGNPREDLSPTLTSSDRSVASIDEFGTVVAMAPGTTVIRAEADGLIAERTVRVLPNPVASIELLATASKVRTGDVVTFTARLKGHDGEAISDIPVQYSVISKPDDSLGEAASAQVDADGRFVAETPGLYTVVVTCGSATTRSTVQASKRFKTERKIELVGRGQVQDAHTSDLWVWEGVDGRDYAVTGTWGANGETHFWDVTNPADIKRIATVTVDARTVNDVKVSKDGTLCVISREGASNRKNGIVLIDVKDPSKPEIISTFTDELTGGVHNLFIDGDYVYALSAGRRYDVISIKDRKNPVRVGSYQVFEPGSSIHDVWVEDGIAYSSNWRHGVHLVDVGNGIAGGTPEKPVKITDYAYPSGWNHAAFPFKNRQTEKRYVIAGDEAFPFGLHVKDSPTYARGWMHFIDFTDLKNPKEVARYQVPEAGTHNLWVEDDLLYAAYYNGGLRVVDISGDLKGDLYRQGREIAWFMPTDKDGVVPNAPMVWGPQPHKGHIFFSDWNSGLWAVKLTPEPVQ